MTSHVLSSSLSSPFPDRGENREPLVLAGMQIRPARLEDIRAIVALHSEAFADTFEGAFGADGIDRGAAALATTWYRQGMAALRGMFVVEYEGKVIGTTTLRTSEMFNDDAGFAEVVLQEELGIWRALRSIFVFSLIDHRIDRHEGFVADVAVQSFYQRNGVARALLAQIESEARRRHKRYLGLYVSARNRPARSLYQQLGFVRIHTRRSFFAWLLLRQGTWLYMRKQLE